MEYNIESNEFVLPNIDKSSITTIAEQLDNEWKTNIKLRLFSNPKLSEKVVLVVKKPSALLQKYAKSEMSWVYKTGWKEPLVVETISEYFSSIGIDAKKFYSESILNGWVKGRVNEYIMDLKVTNISIVGNNPKIIEEVASYFGWSSIQ